LASILISGLINFETTLAVDGFPVTYAPVRYPFFGVRSTAAGVGLNLGVALATLGHQVTLLSLVGNDAPGQQARAALATHGIADAFVLSTLPATCQSVILYEPSGQRAIFTDLKDVQQRAYPLERFHQAAAGAELLALCNINFSRALLHEGKRLGKTIASDVHAIAGLDDEYNHDFMALADILFFSDARLAAPPLEIAQGAMARFGNRVIVVGMGAQGALLLENQGDPAAPVITQVPALTGLPVVSTVGAGDALFAAFLHGWVLGQPPAIALAAAIRFAAHKIGTTGAAEGFLTAAQLAS
jgi:ribokinase